MGGVDVGGGGGKRQMNSDINMIPFIDLLLVTVAFLLITAVWTTFSRINANAQVPGPPDPSKVLEPTPPEKVLHLYIKDGEFALVWKQAATVVSESSVTKPSGEVMKYAELAEKLGEEWKLHGGHQDKSDLKPDQAVLHADNTLPFKEIIRVLDALYNTQREVVLGGKIEKVPVFNMTFSVR